MPGSGTGLMRGIWKEKWTDRVSSKEEESNTLAAAIYRKLLCARRLPSLCPRGPPPKSVRLLVLYVASMICRYPGSERPSNFPRSAERAESGKGAEPELETRQPAYLWSLLTRLLLICERPALKNPCGALEKMWAQGSEFVSSPHAGDGTRALTYARPVLCY